MPHHHLASVPGSVLWGRLPARGDAPVLTIAPGDTVELDTVSHEGILDDQGRDPLAFFGAHGVAAADVLDDAVRIAAEVDRDPAIDGPHVVTGPVEVRGARPGDVLAMTVLGLRRRVDYGVISHRHGRGALPEEFPATSAASTSTFVRVIRDEDGTEHAVLPHAGGVARFPLSPFLGIMGVASAELARPHSVPPAAFGGNIDVTLLTPGATLYLPVQVDGALAYVGDPHFAQGDGEVGLTALEASLTATIRFDLIPAEAVPAGFGTLSGPLIETPEHLAPTGLDPDLDLAVAACVRACLDLLAARWGVDRATGYSYLSAATDFRISQVVDGTKGVHALIRKADFHD